jgi:hypothetical protein
MNSGLTPHEQEKLAFYQQRHNAWSSYQMGKQQLKFDDPSSRSPYVPPTGPPSKPLVSAMKKPSPEKAPPSNMNGSRVRFGAGSVEDLTSAGSSTPSRFGNNVIIGANLTNQPLKRAPEQKKSTSASNQEQHEDKRPADMMGVFEIGKVKSLTEKFLPKKQ